HPPSKRADAFRSLCPASSLHRGQKLVLQKLPVVVGNSACPDRDLFAVALQDPTANAGANDICHFLPNAGASTLVPGQSSELGYQTVAVSRAPFHQLAKTQNQIVTLEVNRGEPRAAHLNCRGRLRTRRSSRTPNFWAKLLRNDEVGALNSTPACLLLAIFNY